MGNRQRRRTFAQRFTDAISDLLPRSDWNQPAKKLLAKVPTSSVGKNILICCRHFQCNGLTAQTRRVTSGKSQSGQELLEQAEQFYGR